MSHLNDRDCIDRLHRPTATAPSTGWVIFDDGWVCPLCLKRRAAASYAARRKWALPLSPQPGVIPSVGAQRRIQALAVAGWSLPLQAHALEITLAGIHDILATSRIPVQTHRRIVELHDRLWNVTPPCDSPTAARSAAETTKLASERGWQPTMAWDDIDLDKALPQSPSMSELIDYTAVELAIAGDVQTLTGDERELAIRAMVGRGYPVSLIAKRLNVTPRTVFRQLKRLGLHSTAEPRRVAA